MENQHRKIKGYRELSEKEIALMNRIKEHEAATMLLVREVQHHLSRTTPTEAEECERFINAEPGRWASIAKTDFQTGFMALVRAVAQPVTP